MRLPGLPWPFRRDSHAGTTIADGAAGEAAPSASARPASRAWASLPPIQRVVGDAPLVAAPDAFVESVPGVRGLPPILRPLAHEVSPLAPAGVVVAHPHPVPSLTSHGALVPRPVQRRQAAEDASPFESIEAPGGPPAAVPVETAPPSPPTQPPIRRVEAVAPAAIVRPAARPLTQAPSAPEPVVPSPPTTPMPAAGPGMRTVQPSRTGAGPDPTPAPRPGAGGLRRAAATGSPAAGPAVRPKLPPGPSAPAPSPASAPSPAAAPTPPAPAGAASPRAAPVETVAASAGLSEPATPSTSAPSAMHAPRGGPPTPRRAGLGAPIAAPPPSATAPRAAQLPVPLPAQRQRPGGPSAPPGTGRAPLAVPAGGPGTSALLAGSLPLRPTIQRRTGATVSTEASGESRADTVASRLPVLPVSRPPDPGPPAGEDAAAQPEAGRPATGGPPGSAGHLPPVGGGGEHDPVQSAVVRPLAGRRPLRPSVAAQRATPGANPAPASSGPGPAASGGPMLPPDGSSIRGAGPSHPGTQASPDSGGSAGIAAVSRAVPVARQHELATTQPIPGPRAQSGPPGPGGPLPGLRASTADGAGPASPPATVSMPLARTAAPAPAPVAEPTVSRSVGSPPAWPAVEPAQSPEASGAVLAPTATPVIQRVEGEAPMVESSTSSAPSDEELDALVKASFGRFRTRLRNELIQEREARGLTFDTV